MGERKEKIADLSTIGDLSRTSYIPIDKELIKNKNYIVSLRALLDNCCHVTENKDKIISKKMLRSLMRKVFNLQSNKIKTVISVYEELGIISEYDNDTYIVNFITPFISLNPETVQYCLTTLSELSFKVYCYLKNIYDYHIEQGFDTPLMFSVSGSGGLLERCGYYGDSSANRKKMNWILETLQNVGLIEVSNAFPVKDDNGKFHGWYRQLNKVNDRSKAQYRVELQAYTENFFNQDYPENYQPSPMYIDKKKYIYNREAFKDKETFRKMLMDKRNLGAFEDGLNFQDVPRSSIAVIENMIEQWSKVSNSGA